MSGPCPLCDGACAGADLRPLLDERLHWLWARLALVADRRGDGDLRHGVAAVVAPAEAGHRAAAVGLLGGRPLTAGARRRIDLAALTQRLRARGPRLTPGAVAAHATGRRLATRASERALHAARERDLRDILEGTRYVEHPVDVDSAWQWLRRSGWAGRLAAIDAGPAIVASAKQVMQTLPEAGRRTDRRVLANLVAGNPHALDHGTLLGGVVLALLTGLGVLAPGSRPRDAWRTVGVDCDELGGGLLSIGVHPAGWVLPAGVVVTIPPRELNRCAWSPPARSSSWVFVTENPSVMTAAADDPEGRPRLLCTFGTPSALEVAAIGRLASAGWHVAVRADFDPSGLAHVGALLAAGGEIRPWRMGPRDYRASARADIPEVRLDPAAIPATPWAPALAGEIAATGCARYEESLLDALLGDLRRGVPS